MSYSFQTIQRSVYDIEYKEKGSKFLGYASSISDAMEAEAFIEQIKSQHPQATHHCYAYIIDEENTRLNDDGEPSGSAGAPIFNQIKSFTLIHIIVIVVRYYGGTKLGVGGLIKAYKNTAKLTLEHSKIVEIPYRMHLRLEVPYDQIQPFMRSIDLFEGSFEEVSNHPVLIYDVSYPLKYEGNIQNYFEPFYTIIIHQD